MDDGTPSLEVGFEIDTSNSYQALLELQRVMDSTEVKVVNDAASIERATRGMIDLTGATASITSFGNAATKELQAIRRERDAAERGGEGVSRQLEKDIANFGKTRAEIRATKIETAALRAEQAGLTELAGRLRAQQEALAAAHAGAAAMAASEAQALRDAAFAHQMFEARAREGAAALREMEAAAEAERRALDATAIREAAWAHQMFEAHARAGAQAMREAEAAAMAQQRALVEANRETEQSARRAAAAEAAQAASVNSLRAAVDPLAGAQQRLSRELENAVRLYRAGAIGMDEYEASTQTLGARIEMVRQAQARQAAGMDDATDGARLRANDLTNIMFQLQDIFVSLASGQNPFVVLIQQGAQLGGIMAQTGMSAAAMAQAIFGLFVVTTPTAAAVAALAAADAQLAAAQAAATASGTTAAISAAELAVATEVAAAAATADANAQRALAVAQAAVAGSAAADAAAIAALAAAQAAATITAAEMTAAEAAVATATTAAAGASELATAAASQLAAAQAAAAAAGNAAAASATRALAPWLRVLGPFALALGAAAAAIKVLQSNANEGRDMEAYAKSLGLTAKEVRNLDDVTITFGDTAKAVFQVAGRAIWDNIGPAVTRVWTVMKEWTAWIFSGVKAAVNFMIGGFVGAYTIITENWSKFPAVIGDVFYSAVNNAIGAINALIEKAVSGVNGSIDTANGILAKAGLELPQLTAPQIEELNNQYKGAAEKFGKTVTDTMGKAMGVDYIGNAGAAVFGQAEKNARSRLYEQALEAGYLDPEAGNKGRTPSDRLAREAEATEAQIRNLYALAAAYRVSGAEALIAEARVKAESEAIKKRGDVEAMVNRQIRLAIAQRIKDAAESTAAMREQATIQSEVNARVAAGNLTSERAAEIVRERIADLPLLAAAQAAQQRGLAAEASAAMKALADQQAIREDMRKAEEEARFNASIADGADRLAMLREELRLVGATNEERVRALALLKATQEAETYADPVKREAYIAQQMAIAEASLAVEREADALRRLREEFDYLTDAAREAGDSIARAFGGVGDSIADVIDVLTEYQRRQNEIDEARKAAGNNQARQRLLDKQTRAVELQSYTALAGAAKTFFKQGSDGYKAMAAAEKAFALVQLANTAVNVAAGAAKIFASLGPFAFPVVAAMLGVMAALGFSKGGGAGSQPQTNEGTGTVLGDSEAKSESIKRSIDALREIDTLMLNYSRQMAGSLRTIEDNIQGFASLLVRNADGINANMGVKEGFKSNAGTTLAGIGFLLGGALGAGIGALLTKIPIVGSILKGLFGTKTTVVGSGLFGGSQSLEDILAGGFDAQYYSDIKKKKKFFGISAGTSYSTQYSSADPLLENQFTLILREFNNAILAAAGPLGAATAEIQQRLNGFVLNIGKIDLKGLTGEQIDEKLNAVFGAAADDMARAAFPFIDQFQKAGEGAFETLVRVASTIEAVTASLDMLGQGATDLSIAVKLGLADQFDSVSDFTNAIDAYFGAFYTKEEQAAARMAQMTQVFESLGLTLPTSLAAFRQLVEAQDLNTEAGRAAYATLLKLAPAFADLQAAMEGAKSAADIASERQDLQRQLLELRGDTAALRALQLAKLDPSNRALQEQIWAVQDAQAAAKAADELRKAWQSVGDSIMDEVRRIRGLTDANGGGGFASLLAQFNAANAAARGGDMDAAKSLPQLSQALLAAAADAATSRQELDRVRAQTAAALEATFGLVNGLAGNPTSNAALLNAGAASQAPGAANDNAAADSVDELRAETVQLRADLTAALATIAANTGAIKRKLDDVTAQSGGDAVSTVAAA
ncbi:hypothetical protein BWQ93_05950 [Sphingopyxis sp. QXT-31]|uniref:hypothetical protein n=1 Tax=Sphingopyxis sp. QXT-31 TaxID=1357916 RepID=UPI00097915DF|nr:hypothetical protein [Sphingopyxis sp. QXT-31]APZ98073.1 hypothetical protein BWQ93_05950 [Sphingopyxis sp. QXT-31]